MASDQRPTTKDHILILHGWAPTMTGKRYSKLVHILQKEGYTVCAPDLPGFGSEKLVKNPMGLDDYVSFVHSFLAKRKIKKVILIGHSFGGRIAAIFAARYPKRVEKLVISGSPLIRQPHTIKQRIGFVMAKPGKIMVQFLPRSLQNLFRKLLYKSLGEWDYYKAGALRDTMKAIIAHDVASYLPNIVVPTLVLWGENDTVVPLTIGREIARKVPNAAFVSVKNAGHRLPYENPERFAKETLVFLQ